MALLFGLLGMGYGRLGAGGNARPGVIEAGALEWGVPVPIQWGAGVDMIWG